MISSRMSSQLVSNEAGVKSCSAIFNLFDGTGQCDDDQERQRHCDAASRSFDVSCLVRWTAV